MHEFVWENYSGLQINALVYDCLASSHGIHAQYTPVVTPCPGKVMHVGQLGSNM